MKHIRDAFKPFKWEYTLTYIHMRQMAIAHVRTHIRGYTYWRHSASPCASFHQSARQSIGEFKNTSLINIIRNIYLSLCNKLINHPFCFLIMKALFTGYCNILESKAVSRHMLRDGQHTSPPFWQPSFNSGRYGIVL